ncbi:MAG: hypothetical protein FWD08_02985, partial [Alphaproteobacteria bacterium]|nr:hypothetical protein [Alphaproteobacteria bacterium]
GSVPSQARAPAEAPAARRYGGYGYEGTPVPPADIPNAAPGPRWAPQPARPNFFQQLFGG